MVQLKILKITLSLIALVEIASANTPSVPSDYQTPPCNKTKIVDKVPIYELCSWNKIEWIDYVSCLDINDCNLHGNTGNYLANQNIPTQVVIKDGYGYVLIEREHGVYSTCNRFELKDIDDNKKCPALRCFPDCPSNALAYPNCTTNPYYLTNVRAIHFDDNGLTWLLDVGSYLHNDKVVVVQPPRICFYAPGSTTPNCTEIPAKYCTADNAFYFKTWLVNTNDGAGFQYFYILNSKTGQIVVFYEGTFAFWAIRSNSFKAEPHQSLFQYALQNYHKHEYIVYDGIFTGFIDVYGIYFSCKAGNKLYFLSYKFLNDPSYENCPELDYHIKFLGFYNEQGQTVGLVRDNNVIYSLQVQNRALACFNKKLKLEPEIIQLISIDERQLTHLSSIQLYQDKTDCKKVYFMSNNAIDIELYGFDPAKKNFIISYVDVKEVEKLYPECKDYYTNYYRDLHGLQDKDYSAEMHAAQLISGPQTKVYDNTKIQKTYELPKIPAPSSSNTPPAPYPVSSPIYYQIQYPSLPYPVSMPAPYIPPQTPASSPAEKPYTPPAPEYPSYPSSLVYGQ